MATQNPIEMEGTYPLPEAQLDRFLMKILVTYPTRRAQPHRRTDDSDRNECRCRCWIAMRSWKCGRCAVRYWLRRTCRNTRFSW